MGQLDIDERAAALGRAAYYEVQTGDTLADIARRFELDAHELARANGLAAGVPLRIGQQLQVNGLT